MSNLEDIAKQMVMPGKGILAADERRDISCDKPPSSSTPNTKLINNDNDKVASVSITSVVTTVL